MLDALLGDVLPDVELGPVAQREHPDVLALVVAAVVEAPQLGPLVLRVPLAEVVAEAEHPLLGPGLLLVAAGTAERGVEAVLLDGVEQRRGLQAVAAGPRTPVSSTTRPWSIDSWTEATTSFTPSSATRRSRNSSTSSKLWPVSMCITGNGMRAGQNAFSARRSMTIESLPPREQQHRALELGGHLADDVDRFGLEDLQVGQLVGWSCSSAAHPRASAGKQKPTC